MDHLLYIGGPTSDPKGLPPVLDSLDPAQQEMAFEAWLACVWLYSAEGLAHGSDFGSVDLGNLRQQFRREYSATLVTQLRGGTTLEETYLLLQILNQSPMVLGIADRFDREPLSRVERRWSAAEDVIVAALYSALQGPHEPVRVIVSDGQWAHAILITGVSPTSGWFVLYDPWTEQVGGVRSLLCAGNNRAGVAASRDSTREHRWQVTPAELGKVFVAFCLPVRILKQWFWIWASEAKLHEALAEMSGRDVDLGKLTTEVVQRRLGVINLDSLGSPRPPKSAAERALDQAGYLGDARRYDDAVREYEYALANGDDAVVAMAGYEFGMLLGNRYRDWDRADHLFERVVATGDPGWTPLAAWQLGLSHARRGYQGLAESRRYFRIAAESGHLDVFCNAAFMYARTLTSESDESECVRYLKRALEHDDGERGAKDLRARAGSAKELGDIRFRHGDYGEALALYQRGFALAGSSIPDVRDEASAGMQAAQMFLDMEDRVRAAQSAAAETSFEETEGGPEGGKQPGDPG